MAATPTIDELTIAADPERWRALGFEVREDGACDVGTVRLRLAGAGAGEGILGWTLRGVATDDLDGLPTVVSAEPERDPAPAHPNTAIRLDHVVVFTADLERTTARLEAAGMGVRRIREAGPLRQAFLRLGEVILEVVTGPDVPAGPARFWGIVAVVEDIDACATGLGSALGAIRDAVQPGRRIATARPDAGAGLPLAVITSEDRAQDSTRPAATG